MGRIKNVSAVNGLGMLASGAEAFELWTDEDHASQGNLAASFRKLATKNKGAYEAV